MASKRGPPGGDGAPETMTWLAGPQVVSRNSMIGGGGLFNREKCWTDDSAAAGEKKENCVFHKRTMAARPISYCTIKGKKLIDF